MKQEDLADTLFQKIKGELNLLKGIGGLTISGGEPLLQSQSIVPLAALCHQHGISVALETSACVEYQNFERLEGVVDHWLFGLKQTAPPKAKSMMGADAGLIAQNFRKLAAAQNEKIIVRIPMIHPYTDDIENIQAIAGMMEENGVFRAELLRYNPYTPHYYHGLGLDFNQQDFGETPPDYLNAAEAVFKKHHIQYEYLM